MVDLSGATLSQSMSLSRTTAGLSSTDSYLLGQVDWISGTPKLVVVRTGLFDDVAGRVEISGPGLAPGMRVEVPSR